MPIGLITYQDASRREDLTDVVTNISPDETPLLSMLGRGSDARQTLHEYPTDTFASAADNAQVEAADHTAVDHTQPSRASNNTQIFTDNITVSDTAAVVDGVVNALEYQMTKNMKEHAKDIELALMAGSRASGASGVARRLTGVINALTSNATTMASASTLSETVYNDIMELVYGSTDQLPDMVFVGGKLKRAISAFAGASSGAITIPAAEVTRYNKVDFYEGDFGRQRVMLHRDVPNAAAGRSLVAINSNYHKLSYLRPTTMREIAKTGDAEKRQIVTELTIEHRGEKTGAVVNRFAS
jgi:hypothetical protein